MMYEAQNEFKDKNSDNDIVAKVRDVLIKDKTLIADLFERLLRERLMSIVRGTDGRSPVKGTDYFTEKEQKQFVEEVLSLVPKPKDGDKGDKGDKGDTGDTGDTPIPGVDYHTKEQVEKMLGEKMKLSQKEIEQHITTMLEKMDFEKMARGLETLRGTKRLDYKALKNRPGIDLGEAKERIHRGGGTSEPMSPTSGAIDDSNLTFTFLSEPRLVGVNGLLYRHGKGVTISGTTVTLDNPVGTGGDIYGLK